MSAATTSSKVVGALACQRDSYLKSFATKVVSCQEVQPVVDKKSKKDSSKVDQPKVYEVELEDTILFPEGGGQPSDEGSLVAGEDSKNIFVSYIKRDGLIARHITNEPVKVGETVKLELNWKKRFDHMQQHTGQHLLSAIMDKYDLPTLSWSMGTMINYIEIPRKISEEEIEKISAEVNSKITENIPIKVEVPHKDEVDTSKMPDDYDTSKGVLRVIHIGDLDANPCCGTHLSSTGQIKGIALLNQVPGKGSNSRLNFLAGDRIIAFAQSSNQILKSLSTSMSCQYESLIEKVSALSVQAKKSSSREQTYLKEIATYKSSELIKQLEDNLKIEDKKNVVFLHRPDVGLEFLNQVFKEVSASSVIKDNKGTVVLVSGEGKEGGAVIVFGEKTEETVTELKKALSGLKGGGKGKFQGKVTAFGKGELESLKRYFETL